MKKIVFLCLLSLTLCLSKPVNESTETGPTPTQATPVLQANVPVTSNQTKNEMAIDKGPNSHTEQATKPETTVNPSGQAKIQSSTETSPQPTDKNEKQQATPIDNKTTEKKEESTPPKTEELTPTSTPSKEAASKPAEKSDTEQKPADKPTTETAPKTEVPKSSDAPKPTEAPKADTDTVKPDLHARGFDGPSFIGGIILTLGLLAIGFMGFKYYKNQTERNYHTL